jgi:hypothetical protein
MDALYNQTFHHLDNAFKRLESMLPLPQKFPHGDSFVFRYKEQTIHQAIIQKLARLVSGLRASQLLCEHGLLQEQGVVQRTLEEFYQDVWFLVFAIINKEVTPLHQTYIDAFYKEEFDPASLESLLDRPMVPRKKIRAYLARMKEMATDPSTSVKLDHCIHSAYSGYVHGASSHIMDMIAGDPPRFQLHGATGTLTHEIHRYDLYNVFFRAIIAFSIAAKAFGDDELCKSLNAYLVDFDKLSGRNETRQNRQPQSAPKQS